MTKRAERSLGSKRKVSWKKHIKSDIYIYAKKNRK